jgi:two-component system NtrC family sensor kinase
VVLDTRHIGAGAALATRPHVPVSRTRWLVLSMVLTVVLVTVLTYWDERGRSESGLEDLGAEQAAIARAAGLATGSNPDAVKLRDLELDGARVITIAPGASDTRLLDGRLVNVPGLAEAAQRGQRVFRVSREDAPMLGLPPRTAMIGIARLASGWSICVVASAERQRDRDIAGLYRMLLAMALAVGVVTAFGGLALSRQRSQLELARELAVADMSRAKDTELERLSRSATMAALGSGIAHELSTPLGVIVGRAEQLLARASGDERATKAAQTIIDQAGHVDRVVRGLLGLARGTPVALREIEPRELVREAAALVEHRFARANVHLVPVVSATVPQVRCEPLLFKHALVNLLLNACDASPSGSTVRIDVQADSAEVAFVVTDEGEGITPANAARAIDPFFTTKPAGQGSGLGLAIANEIASTHRGTLAIGPMSPRGTRASITIPAGGARA